MNNPRDKEILEVLIKTCAAIGKIVDGNLKAATVTSILMKAAREKGLVGDEADASFLAALKSFSAGAEEMGKVFDDMIAIQKRLEEADA